MSETSPSPPRPAWVTKRDGRLVPFEPDKISSALFAVTEAVGRPDAFLARELADAAVHFLAMDTEGATPSTGQIADTIVKVVRELGQPALAQAFAEYQHRTREPGQRAGPGKAPAAAEPEIVLRFSPHDPPAQVADTCLRAFGLRAVFSRDLQSAQADGLITLTGLEAPLHLTACVLDPDPAGRPGSLVEAVEQARHCAGSILAIDGPEYALAPEAAGALAGAAGSVDFLRELGIGLRATGRWAVVNLNSAAPPGWAEHLAEGPLFAPQRPAVPPESRTALAADLLEALLAAGDAHRVRVDWHLGPRDLTPEAAGRLARLGRLALEAPALAFAFDRPRKAVPLAEGLDRRHSAVLLTVGLHLTRLAELPGVGADPERFIQKLGSLTRLALSAAAQKRDFLRRNLPETGALRRGFLLDRARLVVTPVGLGQVARTFTGADWCADRPALDFARRVVQRLRDVLRQDGPTYQLDACVDGAGGGSLDGPEAGLTPWDATAPPKNQLRVAGALHAAEAGTAVVLLAEDREWTGEQVADLLRHAGQQTDVVRLRFGRAGAPPRQLSVPWETAGG
jgi:hypothetical protein